MNKPTEPAGGCNKPVKASQEIIPANKDMSILHGVLHLFEPAAPRGLRLPIDFFLRSLAEDRHDTSIDRNRPTRNCSQPTRS